MIELVDDFEFGTRKIKIIENSDFFAHLEIKNDKAWVVWGNPNCKRYNETLVKDHVLAKMRYQIGHYLDNKRENQDNL